MAVIGYPDYVMDEEGLIFSREKLVQIKYGLNNHGVVKVNLLRDDGKRTSVPVANLVARVFIDNPNPEINDSVIHMDGNRKNLHPANLRWRPRWFAIEYHKQFDDFIDEDLPVIEVETGRVFGSAMSACIYYGLLYSQLMDSIISNDPDYNGIKFTTYPTLTNWRFYAD
jgi:hypothetical protein